VTQYLIIAILLGVGVILVAGAVVVLSFHVHRLASTNQRLTRRIEDLERSTTP